MRKTFIISRGRMRSFYQWKISTKYPTREQRNQASPLRNALWAFRASAYASTASESCRSNSPKQFLIAYEHKLFADDIVWKVSSYRKILHQKKIAIVNIGSVMPVSQFLAIFSKKYSVVIGMILVIDMRKLLQSKQRNNTGWSRLNPLCSHRDTHKDIYTV